jgi:Ca-activated chloride channel family protein
MPAKINIERMMHRNSIAVLGETAATYCLVKLIPSGDGGGRSLGLNLALVLDVSGSMYEEDGTGINRLKRVQDAARSAIDKLNPSDTLAIVAFAYNASLLLPPTTVAEKDKILDVIQKIDMYDVDPGGTAMDQGIQLALDAVEKNQGPGKLARVVILTDGETSGEQVCRQLAKQAADKKIQLSIMGVGTEWNANLIKDLAKISTGKWYYIDVNDAAAAEQVFLSEFESLAAAGFLNVEIKVKPVKDVVVKRIRQVVPEIKALEMSEPEPRAYAAAVGTLERDKTSRYIVDLSLPKRPDGKYVIAQLEVSFDPGNGKREGTTVPLEMTYTSAGHGYINAEVAKHIDEVQVQELNQVLQVAIAKDDKAEVQKVAEMLVKKGESMGKSGAKKTMLAKAVLEEVKVGRVSKKTQLAFDQVAKEAADMPTN